MTSGGYAIGQSVNNVSSSQVIYACVTGVNGNITKVSNTPKTCPKGTTPISWNMAGPKGDQGIPGTKGDPGVIDADALAGIIPTTTYIKNNLDGNKYPLFNSPWSKESGLLSVQIDGHTFSVNTDQPELKLNYVTGFFPTPYYFFTDTNCSSETYRVAERKLNSFEFKATVHGGIPTSVTSYSQVSSGIHKGNFIVQSQDFTLNQLKSVHEPSLGCVELSSISYWLDRFESAYDYSLATLETQAAGSSSGQFMVDFFSCRFTLQASWSSGLHPDVSIDNLIPNCQEIEFSEAEYQKLYLSRSAFGNSAVGPSTSLDWNQLSSLESRLESYRTWAFNPYAQPYKVTQAMILNTFDAENWSLLIE